MNKIVLPVPVFIRYLSQWKEFRLYNFSGHNILHKQIPGCGFTEFALTCPESVVLCSPRKMLMENKKEQHGEDVYLVVNEYEIFKDIDEDVSKPETVQSLERKDKDLQNLIEKQKTDQNVFYDKLFHEIYDYIGRMGEKGKPIKIIVTYDSTYLVKQVLESMGIINSFWFIVDEFQSILEDSRFKADTELEFLTVLQYIKNVLFVSATPMLDKYLEQIIELSSLPYYELDWYSENPSRVKKPTLKVRVISSPSTKMIEIIKSYLDGKFEKVIVERDDQFKEIESREAIFYCNCVNTILSVIKKVGLKADQVNILCSDTPENQRKIEKKLGKRAGFKIGRVPLRGEPSKMFTFCTRTVYLGADFYSTNARSFIFSDSNSDCLSVDISMDLAQILGRIRLDENPWKNCAEFYYRTTCDYKKMTQEDLDRIIERKTRRTLSLLESYNSSPTDITKNDLADAYLYITRTNKYKDNYVAVNRKIGNTLIPVLNNLVRINEQRSFDIQQVDYENRFSVFASIEENFESTGIEQDTLKLFFEKYDSLTQYVEKIHYIVDYILENPSMSDPIISNLVDSDKIKQQLIVLGPGRIKGLGYNLTRINKAMGITIFDKSSFIGEIYSAFAEGQRYTKKFIKEKLREIYLAADFKGTPKASDLGEFFEIKSSKIYINKKQEHGFEIIKKK